MNLVSIKERFMKESFNRRLGHLASDLARITSFLDNPKNTKTVSDILEESKYFIEWMAADAPYLIQELFSEMQLKLALWHYYLLNDKYDSRVMDELRTSTKNWSNQLIELSGIKAI